MSHGRVEQVHKPQHVDPGVKGGFADRAADRHLGRLMADGVGSLPGEDPLDRLRVGDVGHVQGHAGREIVGRATRQVVEHRRRVARREQGVDDVAADESGAAGDEDLHVPKVWMR